ncbi:Sec20-domain-containing protein [Neurospora tetraspora]|uniref:Sec20-domain-containing protein n=1 Tax=Neurospora tetraspora TaxID=94610 RepID=A0AAE0JQV3_9PEZI|nr:Sec20-domain-containing protein [Neurospora tetraspora]
MSSFETLQERLTALQETTGQLKELIERLATLKFEPGSVPLSNSISSLANTGADGNTNNEAADLSAEISQVLREEEEDLELLQEEIIDLRSGRPGSEAEHKKTRLKEGAQRLAVELKSCRTSFRKAQLAARRNLETAQRLERQLLLASYVAVAANLAAASSYRGESGTSTPVSSAAAAGGAPQPTSTTPPPLPTSSAAAASSDPSQPPLDPRQALFGNRRRKQHQTTLPPSHDSEVVSASSTVTDALRRTHALIASEVAKSAFASQTLAESTAALKELQRSYEGIDSLLSRSRDLVSTLLQSQKSDTWYLRTSLYMLLCTLGWLVFRRWLYGPLWWVLWLPLKMVWKGGRVAYDVSTTHHGHGGVETGAGGGARMEVLVGDENGKGGRSVVGMAEEGAVPTVQVEVGGGGGGGKAKKRDNDNDVDPESMVEKVGRIIEENLPPLEDEKDDAQKVVVEDPELEQGWIGQERIFTGEQGEKGEEEEEEVVQRNPKKRMWEEPVVNNPIRDEL